MEGSLTPSLALPPPPMHPKGGWKGGWKGGRKRIPISKGQGPSPSTTIDSSPESSGQEGSKQDKEGAQKTTGASEGHLWRGFPIFSLGEEALRYFRPFLSPFLQGYRPFFHSLFLPSGKPLAFRLGYRGSFLSLRDRHKLSL